MNCLKFNENNYVTHSEDQRVKYSVKYTNPPGQIENMMIDSQVDKLQDRNCKDFDGKCLGTRLDDTTWVFSCAAANGSLHFNISTGPHTARERETEPVARKCLLFPCPLQYIFSLGLSLD